MWKPLVVEGLGKIPAFTFLNPALEKPNPCLTKYDLGPEQPICHWSIRLLQVQQSVGFISGQYSLYKKAAQLSQRDRAAGLR